MLERHPPARARNQAATRNAILAAARVEFSARGYDHATVRGIAARAGTDPALVIRYFGSKEKLFGEAIAEEFAFDDWFGTDRAQIGRFLARIVSSKPAGSEDPFLATLRSAGNPAAVDLIRKRIESTFLDPLGALIGGPEAQERAAEIAALITGVIISRKVLNLGPYATMTEQQLDTSLARSIQRIVDGAPK